MGRIAWCWLLVLAFAVQGQSQETEDSERRFRFGVRAGLATTQIDGDGYTGYHKFGPLLGFFTNLSPSEKINVQLELLYLQKGSRRNADSLDRTFYRIALNYIEVPVLIRFPYKRFLFETGLSGAVLFASDEEDNNGDVNQSIFNWHPGELAFNFGINFRITDQLYSNVRWTRSVLPVSDTFEVDPRFGLIGGSYNDVVSFTLLYQFL